MKNTVRAAFAVAGKVDGVLQLFRLLNFVGRCLAEPLHQAQRARLEALDAAEALKLSPRLEVLHGPFAGMRYPRAQSTGSTLLPKIIGSYESELHGVMATILGRQYSDIVDIGCAEGYYAVGLGLRFAEARIHAFDTDVKARRMCLSMAQANGIEPRIALAGLCDETTLLALVLGPRALVVSDCEGYEAQLFTPRVAAGLARHDVLIEVHDRTDPQLGIRLRNIFAGSHDCVAVDSIDDARKARGCAIAELEGLDLTMRRALLSEGRPVIMEWLFFSSRSNPESQSRQAAELRRVA